MTIALLQYQLPEVIYALTIKLEPKGGLFRSAFSFCYIVRITRFPRESLADLCLFDLKRSQVRFHKAEPSGYLTVGLLG